MPELFGSLSMLESQLKLMSSPEELTFNFDPEPVTPTPTDAPEKTSTSSFKESERKYWGGVPGFFWSYYS